MNARDQIIHALRNQILQSTLATSAINVPVSIYRNLIFHIGPDRKEITPQNGTSVSFRSESREEIRHLYPVYGEAENLSRFASDIQPDDVVYDIGAHVGFYSCVAAKIVDESNILSFEPHPANIERLLDNAALNEVTLQTYQYALSDSNRSGEFAIDADEPGAVGHTDPYIRDQRIEVDFVRGEDLVERENLPKPTIIKIDVEGAELAVLRGLEGVMESCKVIYCELSDDLERYGDSREELLQFLRERGFVISSLGAGGTRHDDIRAVRDSSRK